MDIEGGEYSLMEEDPQIFTRFKNLFTEIHGETEKRNQFIKQISDLGFEIVRNQLGEAGNINTIYARRKI